MKTCALLLTAVLMAATAWIPAATQDRQVLFEKALVLEEVQGKPQEAIAIYQKIVDESKDQALAARAQLRIAMCYEKMGREEAYRAYAEVLNKYAGQAEAVDAAKKRMSDMKGAGSGSTEATRGLKLTKIHTGRDYADALSPDGKKLVIRRQPDLWVRNIADGKELRLTDDSVSKSGAFWSPDGRWIAFSDADRSVRVVQANGGAVKTLFAADPNSQKTGNVVPVSWTSDSMKVICRAPLKGLLAIPVSGEKAEEILVFQDANDAKEREEMVLSPDGKLIAYVSSRGGNRDIYVMPAKGGSPVQVTGNPAEDTRPRWSYDGRYLAFDSVRTESPEIWIIRISPEGKPEGQELQVSRGGYLVGNWTRDGRIGYSTAFRIQQVFAANADGSGEVQLTQFPAFNSYPRWSTDGTGIIFTSDHGRNLGEYRTWIMPSTGGGARLVYQGEKEFYEWSPDGKMRAFATVDQLRPNKYLVKVVAAEGGDTRELLSFDQAISYLAWSPDGKRISFIHGAHPSKYSNADEYVKGSFSGLSLVSVESGELKNIIPADTQGRGVSGCSWSPDGRKIACRVFDYQEWVRGGRKGEGTGILIKDITTGDSKLIPTVADGYRLCWSPDGRSVIYEQRVAEMDFDLYKVPAEGGIPEKTNIKGRFAQFSPDGKRIAYSRWIGAGYEFWVAENFLPVDKKEK